MKSDSPQNTSRKKSSTQSRTRNFATVVYPESAPSEWQRILDDTRIPCIISPIHDRDINQTAEKTPKKAHYHVIIMFSSVKTEEQARGVIDSIGGVGCEAVQSIRGYARYLCHLDNPDKAQYNQADVVCLNGADYYGSVDLATDKYKAIAEMMDFCDDHCIVSFFELMQYARKNRMDWFRVLCDSATCVMREYLKSIVWTNSTKM